jgi:hypothetical protein
MQSYDGNTGEAFTNVYAEHENGTVHMGEKLPIVIARSLDESWENKENAHFIARARTGLPAALETIAALRTQLAAEQVAYKAVETERNEAVAAVEVLADRMAHLCYDGECPFSNDATTSVDCPPKLLTISKADCAKCIAAWARARAKAQKDGVTG